MRRMTRLAGITSLYALIAALLLVTPLSASQDPVPEAPAPEAVEPEDTPPSSAVGEPAPAQAGAGSAETVPQGAAPGPAPQAAAPGTAPQGAAPEGTAPAEPAPQSAAPQGAAPASEPAAAPVADGAAGKPKPRRTRDAPRATAAADTGVTIRDFEFAPGAVTVDVGDTVTWTNEGPTPHSATADDGSFDTGIYDAGQSRSHTFDQAGTFAYFCTPHPNMRGTVTVRAAATGGNGAGGGGGATGGDTTGGGTSGDTAGTGTSGDSSGSGLPATGLDTGSLALLGLVTLALGAFLRRRAAAAE
jgi:LPXTG-motif cell wall-anchored protein